MRRLVLHGGFRQWITRLHRWSGLVVMAGLLVAAVTGTWLVFRVELDRWVNPQLRVVQPAQDQLPLADIAARVERRFPAALVSTLSLQQRPDDALSVYLGSKGGAPLEYDQVFVNPYNGEILGQRSTTRIVFAKEYLDPLVMRLHYSLLMNAWGLWLMGMCALLWLVTNVLGLALSWPQLWLRLSGWAPILSARLSGGAYKTNYQLHRTLGVWLLPTFTVLAFTSVELNLPQYIRPAVNALSPLVGMPPGRTHASEDIVVSFDQALASVTSRFPEARHNSIYRDARNGRYSIYFHLPGDVSPLGDNFAYVDVQSGSITALKLPAKLAAGDRFMTWLYPLHTGAAFGLVGRLLIAVTGVGLVGLNVTGLYVWWCKWRMRRRARSRSRAVELPERNQETEAA